MVQSAAGSKATRSRGPRSARELIVLANARGQAMLAGNASPGPTDRSFAQLHGLLNAAGARLVPILRRSSAASVPTMGPPAAPRKAIDTPSRFFLVDAPDSALEDLRAHLSESPLVGAAYIKPPSDTPSIKRNATSSATSARRHTGFYREPGLSRPASWRDRSTGRLDPRRGCRSEHQHN